MSLVEEEELKKIAPASSKATEIMELVAVEGVDPLSFDASYLVAPEEAGLKSYLLLLQGMTETGRAPPSPRSRCTSVSIWR
jgi:non-homologous end joining protein Ku